jgi:hypothetical protein
MSMIMAMLGSAGADGMQFEATPKPSTVAGLTNQPNPAFDPLVHPTRLAATSPYPAIIMCGGGLGHRTQVLKTARIITILYRGGKGQNARRSHHYGRVTARVSASDSSLRDSGGSL